MSKYRCKLFLPQVTANVRWLGIASISSRLYLHALTIDHFCQNLCQSINQKKEQVPINFLKDLVSIDTRRGKLIPSRFSRTSSGSRLLSRESQTRDHSILNPHYLITQVMIGSPSSLMRNYTCVRTVFLAQSNGTESDNFPVISNIRGNQCHSSNHGSCNREPHDPLVKCGPQSYLM